jgi:hypothetical protein
MPAYEVRNGQCQRQKENDIYYIQEVFPPEKNLWNENIKIEIKKTEQYKICHRILDKNPGKGKRGFARWSDKGEGWNDKEKGNKKSMRQ